MCNLFAHPIEICEENRKIYCCNTNTENHDCCEQYMNMINDVDPHDRRRSILEQNYDEYYGDYGGSPQTTVQFDVHDDDDENVRPSISFTEKRRRLDREEGFVHMSVLKQKRTEDRAERKELEDWEAKVLTLKGKELEDFIAKNPRPIHWSTRNTEHVDKGEMFTDENGERRYSRSGAGEKRRETLEKQKKIANESRDAAKNKRVAEEKKKKDSKKKAKKKRMEENKDHCACRASRTAMRLIERDCCITRIVVERLSVISMETDKKKCKSKKKKKSKGKKSKGKKMEKESSREPEEQKEQMEEIEPNEQMQDDKECASKNNSAARLAEAISTMMNCLLDSLEEHAKCDEARFNKKASQSASSCASTVLKVTSYQPMSRGSRDSACVAKIGESIEDCQCDRGLENSRYGSIEDCQCDRELEDGRYESIDDCQCDRNSENGICESMQDCQCDRDLENGRYESMQDCQCDRDLEDGRCDSMQDCPIQCDSTQDCGCDRDLKNDICESVQDCKCDGNCEDGMYESLQDCRGGNTTDRDKCELQQDCQCDNVSDDDECQSSEDSECDGDSEDESCESELHDCQCDSFSVEYIECPGEGLSQTQSCNCSEQYPQQQKRSMGGGQQTQACRVQKTCLCSLRQPIDRSCKGRSKRTQVAEQCFSQYKYPSAANREIIPRKSKMCRIRSQRTSLTTCKGTSKTMCRNRMEMTNCRMYQNECTLEKKKVECNCSWCHAETEQFVFTFKMPAKTKKGKKSKGKKSKGKKSKDKEEASKKSKNVKGNKKTEESHKEPKQEFYCIEDIIAKELEPEKELVKDKKDSKDKKKQEKVKAKKHSKDKKKGRKSKKKKDTSTSFQLGIELSKPKPKPKLCKCSAMKTEMPAPRGRGGFAETPTKHVTFSPEILKTKQRYPSLVAKEVEKGIKTRPLAKYLRRFRGGATKVTRGKPKAVEIKQAPIAKYLKKHNCLLHPLSNLHKDNTPYIPYSIPEEIRYYNLPQRPPPPDPKKLEEEKAAAKRVKIKKPKKIKEIDVTPRNGAKAKKPLQINLTASKTRKFSGSETRKFAGSETRKFAGSELSHFDMKFMEMLRHSAAEPNYGHHSHGYAVHGL